MVIAIFPLVVAVIGALVFALASNGDAKELGRGAYWCGLFVTVGSLASRTLHW